MATLTCWGYYQIINIGVSLIKQQIRKEAIVGNSILRRLQEENHAKAKMVNRCFVHLEKLFDSVSNNVLEWTMK